MSIMRIEVALSLCLMLMPSPVAARDDDAAVEEQWDDSVVEPRDGATFRRQVMAAHNEVRVALGGAPLVWDDRLAAEAAAYAHVLATTRRFVHAARSAGSPQGENLWMGTRRAYSYRTMIASWTDERRDYRPGRFPDLSRTGSWRDVGHFTQIIWSATRAIGCAIDANADDEYLVCRYFPAGNVWGQDPLDVQNTAATSFANASAR